MLTHQGGAARVANMLAAGLGARGWSVQRSFELRDAVHAGTLCVPADLARLVPSASLLHLHTSKDWLASLGALEKRPERVLLTLHDTRLISGGCSDPLDCPGCLSGCLEICPQGHVGAAARQRAQVAAVRLLRPYIVGPSRWVLDLARSIFAELEGLAFRLVPNGVDPPPGAPNPSRDYGETTRRRWGVSARAKLVVFSAHGGEAAAFKGGAHWLALWQTIKASVPGAVAIMAGGPEHSRDGDLIRVPYMERGELHALLSAADLFLYPSLADNHPLAVLEALCAGTPTLAFAVGGIPEQVENQRNGWLIPHGDWKAFSRATIHLLNNPKLLRDAGRRAFESWKERFTLAHMLDGHQFVYEPMCESDTREK